MQTGQYTARLAQDLHRKFCAKPPRIDIDFRIEILDKTLSRIILLEHKAAQEIVDTFQVIPNRQVVPSF